MLLVQQASRTELQSEWREGLSCVDKLRASLAARLPPAWPEAEARAWAQSAADVALAAWSSTGAAPQVPQQHRFSICCGHCRRLWFLLWCWHLELPAAPVNNPTTLLARDGAVQLSKREHVVVQEAMQLPHTADATAAAPVESRGQQHMEQNGVGSVLGGPVATVQPSGTTA